MENLDSTNEVDSAQILLSEFLKNECVESNSIGQFLPNNKQLKSLVNCIDDTTGKLISLVRIDTSEITNMKSIFYNSTRKDFSGIEKWNVSSVISFAWCFCNAEYFNADISDWDVSNAKQFRDMFYKATAFNQPIGAKWDTKSVEGMIGMFYYAKNFNNGGVPFGEKWVMDKVKLSYYMFCGAENFNQPINHWNISNIINMEAMFMNAKAFNQPLDSWNVSNVEKMQSMFNRAESFNQDLSAWGDKLGKAQNMKRMFADTKALKINFIQSWRLPSTCDKDNLTKGSALESNTKNLKKLNNFIISQIAIKERFYSAWEAIAFKNDYTEWLPNNIKGQFRIYLAQCDENDEIIKGDEKSWDFAIYEIFEHCFLVEKDKECNSDKISDKKSICSIFQKRKISDLQKDENFKQEKIKDIFENSEFDIKLDSQNMWIVNNSLTDDSKSIFGLLNIFILAQSYIIKMQKLEEKARENSTDSKALQKCYKEICEFDLRYYRSLPILNDIFLQDIWRRISDFYMVAKTHDELKEIILQMAQVIGDEVRAKSNLKFNIVMGIITFLSALGAILAAVPVVQGLLK